MDSSSKMKIMVANTRDQIYTPLPLLKTNIFPLNKKPVNICLMFDYPHRAGLETDGIGSMVLRKVFFDKSILEFIFNLF